MDAALLAEVLDLRGQAGDADRASVLWRIVIDEGRRCGMTDRVRGWSQRASGRPGATSPVDARAGPRPVTAGGRRALVPDSVGVRYLTELIALSVSRSRRSSWRATTCWWTAGSRRQLRRAGRRRQGRLPPAHRGPPLRGRGALRACADLDAAVVGPRRAGSVRRGAGPLHRAGRTGPVLPPRRRTGTGLGPQGDRGLPSG